MLRLSTLYALDTIADVSLLILKMYMKCIVSKSALRTAFLAVAFLGFQSLFAAPNNSCASSVALPPAPGSYSGSLKNMEWEWATFTATMPIMRTVLKNANPTSAFITKMVVYGGTCSALVPIDSISTGTGIDSMQVFLSGLSIGQSYHVRVSRTDPSGTYGTNAAYSLSIVPVVYMVITSPTGGCTQTINDDCNVIVCQGDQVCFNLIPIIQIVTGTVVWDIQGSTCPQYDTLLPPDTICCTFNTPGTYPIQLTFIDSANVHHVSSTAYIHVVPPPDTAFTINPSPVCVDEPTTFTYTGYSGSESYIAWDFGDGVTQGCLPNCAVTTTHVYTTPGTYTVTLCLFNGGCDTVCTSQIIQVNPPSANFTWHGTCRLNFVSDTLCGTGIISHSWNFGDPASGTNNTSVLANPTHDFTQNNVTYTVTHTLVTIYGTYIVTQQVIQPGMQGVVISGLQANNCGEGTLTYTVNPCPMANVVYTWTAVGGTGIPSTDGCQIDVNWTNPAGGSLTVIATDTIYDCSVAFTLTIPACCEYSATATLNNRTASSVLSDAGFISSGFVSGSSFTVSGHIVINGIFTIDVPFTFLDCPQIDMGTNAQIQIEPGQSLTIDSSMFERKCDYMWDGIYINGITSYLTVKNGSIIRYAKNAIVSIGGGTYDVERSRIEACVKGIVVQPFAGSHAGTVRSSHFVMNPLRPFLTAVPPLALGVTTMVQGIEISGNADIQVGDATSPIFVNRFDSIYGGVKSTNSITKVVNCVFKNFPVNYFVNNTSVGVWSIGAKPLMYTPKTIVGGTAANEPCDFSNLHIGVEGQYDHDAEITNNTFTNLLKNGTGVQIYNSKERTLLINGNIIDNSTAADGFAVGITVRDCYKSNVSIYDNSITQLPVSSAYTGNGIWVSLVSPGSITATITNNKPIQNVRKGIWLQNLTEKEAVFVSSNDMYFANPMSTYTGQAVHYGIRLEGCATVRCDTNTVTCTGGTPIAGTEEYLRGISIENSPGSIVSDNIFTQMGSGIYGYEISSASKLACNTMDQCYMGVLFEGSASTNFGCDIGDQLLDMFGMPAATGNVWISSVSGEDIAGKADPSINWYWDVSSPTMPFVSTINPIYEQYNACAQYFFIGGNPETEREGMIGKALRTANDPNTGADQQYMLYRYVYRILNQNPTWLSLGTNDDAMYQGFYEAFEQSNIGMLQSIELAADTADSDAVDSTASSMATENTIEDNAQAVYGIYAKTWMSGIDTFTPADSATLLVIANQDPVEGGSAVYSARIMLNYSVDYFGPTNRSMHAGSSPEKDQQSYEKKSLTIAPNPTQGTFVLDYSVAASSKAQIEIRDAVGRVVFTGHLEPGSASHSFDLGGLETGIYMISVMENHYKTQRKIVYVK